MHHENEKGVTFMISSREILFAFNTPHVTVIVIVVFLQVHKCATLAKLVLHKVCAGPSAISIKKFKVGPKWTQNN